MKRFYRFKNRHFNAMKRLCWHHYRRIRQLELLLPLISTVYLIRFHSEVKNWQPPSKPFWELHLLFTIFWSGLYFSMWVKILNIRKHFQQKQELFGHFSRQSCLFETHNFFRRTIWPFGTWWVNLWEQTKKPIPQLL